MTTGFTTGTGDPTRGLTGWWMSGGQKFKESILGSICPTKYELEIESELERELERALRIAEKKASELLRGKVRAWQNFGDLG